MLESKLRDRSWAGERRKEVSLKSRCEDKVRRQLTWNLAESSFALGARFASCVGSMRGRASRSCRAPETFKPLSPFIRLTVSFHLSVSSFVCSYAASRSTLSCNRAGRGAEIGPARLRAEVEPVGAAEFDSAVAARGLRVLRRLASRGFFESANEERRSSS